MIRRRRSQQQFAVDPAAVPGQGIHSGAAPRWVDVLCIVQVVYVIVVAAWMLVGFFGPTITHYVALLSDEPAALIALTIAAATARHTDPGLARATLHDWVPTFALSTEGIVFALVFAVVVWLLFQALWQLLALLSWRGRRVRVPPLY